VGEQREGLSGEGGEGEGDPSGPGDQGPPDPPNRFSFVMGFGVGLSIPVWVFSLGYRYLECR
jgi:hypothetical protein